MPSIPSSLLDVSVLPFGEYDECQDIISPQEYGEHVIKGQYCQISPVIPLPKMKDYRIGETLDPSFYSLNDNLFLDSKDPKSKLEIMLSTILEINDYIRESGHKTLTYGLCIPTDCSPKEIQSIINSSNSQTVLMRKYNYVKMF